MINPLAQRQIFQTANIEAVRQAHEVSGQLQRDQIRQKAADDHLVEEAVSVRIIPHAEALHAEEKKEDRQKKRRQHPEDELDPGETSMDAADPHMDFLA